MTYTIEQLRAEDTTIDVRVLDDGRVLCAFRSLIGVNISISTPEHLALGAKTDTWEYGVGSDLGFPNLAIAAAACRAAFEDWNGDGEPVGWTRHPPSGRRRPQGDPRHEYVRL